MNTEDAAFALIDAGDQLVSAEGIELGGRALWEAHWENLAGGEAQVCQNARRALRRAVRRHPSHVLSLIIATLRQEYQPKHLAARMTADSAWVMMYQSPDDGSRLKVTVQPCSRDEWDAGVPL